MSLSARGAQQPCAAEFAPSHEHAREPVVVSHRRHESGKRRFPTGTPLAGRKVCRSPSSTTSRPVLRIGQVDLRQVREAAGREAERRVGHPEGAEDVLLEEPVESLPGADLDHPGKDIDAERSSSRTYPDQTGGEAGLRHGTSARASCREAGAHRGRRRGTARPRGSHVSQPEGQAGRVREQVPDPQRLGSRAGAGSSTGEPAGIHHEVRELGKVLAHRVVKPRAVPARRASSRPPTSRGFVMENRRQSVSGSTGSPSLRSRRPPPPANTGSPCRATIADHPRVARPRSTHRSK